MSAESATQDEQVTFNVKSSSDAKYTLTLPRTATVLDVKTKLATSEYSDTPVERQRLIYSGRVLKDPDTLDSTQIKDGHTVHMVKSAESNARQNPANQGASSTTGGTPAGAGSGQQVPSSFAAGTGNDPLAGLTGARYAGMHGLPGMDMFGPDGGMGAPPSQEDLLRQMEDPNMLSMLSEAMNNPTIIQQMRNNPMIRNNPMLQQMIDNPEMRRMMFSPEMLRQQAQLSRTMGGMGGMGGQAGGGFPAPGVTDTTPQTQGGTQNNAATGAGASPTPNQTDTTGPTSPSQQANPFAALFQGQQQQQQQGQTQGQQNPFGGLFGNNPAMGNMMQQMMQNPEAMQQAMEFAGPMMGLGNNGGQAGATGATGAAGVNPFAALMGGAGGSPFGGASPFAQPAPADNRPPEERYADQLRQLNDMGFFEFDRNVQALRRSGGSVQGAIEFLLGGS